MKNLTAALILLASFPAFACPFHSFFLDDDDHLAASRAATPDMMQEKPEATTEAGPHAFLQFKSFQSQLMQWKEQKKAQQ